MASLTLARCEPRQVSFVVTVMPIGEASRNPKIYFGVGHRNPSNACSVENEDASTHNILQWRSGIHCYICLRKGIELDAQVVSVNVKQRALAEGSKKF